MAANSATDQPAAGNMSPHRWRTRADLAASVSMIAAGILLVVLVLKSLFAPAADARAARPMLPLPKEPIDLAGAHLRGNQRARLVLIEYSDFQCPYCARFARETLPALITEYVDAGKVLLGFSHLPIAQIHALALHAAQAAECADRQGRFWPMHDFLFSNAKDLADAISVAGAKNVVSQPEVFAACMASVP